ncbi:Uma2 family endonuclease [Anaerolineae bacterium CFX8]|nr:Uma2 family endonuclease [Anaerolineae bacterium CFX8]
MHRESVACAAAPAHQQLEGPPDLIVQIFSPGMVSQDKIQKFDLYERYGIGEYWMVDPCQRPAAKAAGLSMTLRPPLR